ncbi:c-type cytochrome [Paraneptunicella aestuarii]|uniref:c-type cytochrome n=1 Tax=Paraneptunicella aestuarii TaxID=2831148 RepID=UPI001E2D6B20|nr:c-type cytochrome [Paraneptunicella aestuarii]UAA37121.1 c-type cytochrome [Paraneptunicella aestuarii]
MNTSVKAILIAAITCFLLSGCYKGAEAPWGFSLPPGDIAAGEQVFIKYNCMSCHVLENYNSNIEEHELSTPVILGGEVTKVKTYADLLTSVINPSHKISNRYTQRPDEMPYTKMPNFNEVMRVQELVDLVTFLQSKYTLEENKHPPYPRFNYPTQVKE